MNTVHLHTFASETDFLFGDLEDDHTHYLVQADPTGFRRSPKVLKVVGDNFEPLLCYVHSSKVSLSEARTFARRAYPQSVYLPDTLDMWPDLVDLLHERRCEVYAKFLDLEAYTPQQMRLALICQIQPFVRSFLINTLRYNTPARIQMRDLDRAFDFSPEWDLIPSPILTGLTIQQANHLAKSWWTRRHDKIESRAEFWLGRGNLTVEMFQKFLKRTSLVREPDGGIYMQVSFPHTILEMFFAGSTDLAYG